jgi:hypothetical protein
MTDRQALAELGIVVTKPSQEPLAVVRIVRLGIRHLRSKGEWHGPLKERALAFWAWYQATTENCPGRNDPGHTCFSTKIRRATERRGFVLGSAYGIGLQLLWVVQLMLGMGRANSARFNNGGW